MNAKRFSTPKSTSCLGRIGIPWRGDEAARRNVTLETSRFKAVFAALADVGVDAEPVVYEDDVLAAVRAQLVRFDGVLVWVNPGKSAQPADEYARWMPPTTHGRNCRWTSFSRTYY
jgi:hypothetical protein